MKTIKWEKIRNNHILRRDNFYISFNPETGLNDFGFTELGNSIASLIGKPPLKDGTETALCVKPDLWMILEGDFRKEYEEAFPDLEKCKAVYEKHKETNRSNWSTD